MGNSVSKYEKIYYNETLFFLNDNDRIKHIVHDIITEKNMEENTILKITINELISKKILKLTDFQDSYNFSLRNAEKTTIFTLHSNPVVSRFNKYFLNKENFVAILDGETNSIFVYIADLEFFTTEFKLDDFIVFLKKSFHIEEQFVYDIKVNPMSFLPEPKKILANKDDPQLVDFEGKKMELHGRENIGKYTVKFLFNKSPHTVLKELNKIRFFLITENLIKNQQKLDSKIIQLKIDEQESCSNFFVYLIKKYIYNDEREKIDSQIFYDIISLYNFIFVLNKDSSKLSEPLLSRELLSSDYKTLTEDKQDYLYNIFKLFYPLNFVYTDEIQRMLENFLQNEFNYREYERILCERETVTEVLDKIKFFEDENTVITLLNGLETKPHSFLSLEQLYDSKKFVYERVQKHLAYRSFWLSSYIDLRVQ